MIVCRKGTRKMGHEKEVREHGKEYKRERVEEWDM